MNRLPWEPDELAWALECIEAGDSVAEIAEWSDRTRSDVLCTLGLNEPLATDYRKTWRQSIKGHVSPPYLGRLHKDEVIRRYIVEKQTPHQIGLAAGRPGGHVQQFLRRQGFYRLSR